MRLFSKACALLSVLCLGTTIHAFLPSPSRHGRSSATVALHLHRGPQWNSGGPHHHRDPHQHYQHHVSDSSLQFQDTMHDFCEILGVSWNAPAEEIKAAYRSLVKQYHPDANPENDTTEKFQAINQAYHNLMDPELMMNKGDMIGRVRTKTAEPDVRGPSSGRANFGQHFDVHIGDPMGDPDFDDYSNSNPVFHGPIVGEDVRFDLEIDFMTAIVGGQEKVSIRHTEKCDTCEGNGIKPDSKVSTCSSCGGSGDIVQPARGFRARQTCWACRGTGKQAIMEDCGSCRGEGLKQKSKEIRVTIPPGVEDGFKLRVPGEGDAGKNGGPAGDLHIHLKVKEHSVFRRQGADIYSEQSISYLDATMGATITTPAVHGEVSIKVPPGTKLGDVMCLIGNGAPRWDDPEERGDHHITLNVEMPKELDLFKKMYELQLQNNGGVATAPDNGGAYGGLSP